MWRNSMLFEELCWDPDDELSTHDGTEVIIYNKTKENQKKNKPCYIH